MAIDFNNLRSRKGTNFDSLQKKLESQGGSGGGYKKDDRIWKPVANKQNKSENIIRFLPIPFVDLQAVEDGKINETDLTPLAKILQSSFQAPHGWFIERSLQTFGEDCPVREHDRPLWKIAKDNKDKSLSDILKKRIPKTEYYANVYIIKDGTNPENNGKVMLYKFGETVRGLIEKCSKPEFETDPSFDPFDFWEGANLNLNLVYEKKKIGDKEATVPKFDNVKWAAQSVFADGDEEEQERVWKESHSLAEFYDRKYFKTYDELKAKFEKVMGLDGKATAGTTSTKSAEKMLDEMVGESTTHATPEEKSVPESSLPSNDDDDALADFERLMAGE